MATPETTPPRYVIGIDLGTTNCALAYVDLRVEGAAPKILDVDQWETEGTAVVASTLPSFYYLPIKAEWKRGQLQLPIHGGEEPPDFAVGRLARLKSTVAPGRVIHSAKSWLCHGGVSREDRILPWHSDEVVGDERRSPIEVSAAFLAHLRLVWDARIAQGREEESFVRQDVTITVPASFDEVAQRLTLEAAVRAGFDRRRVRLLEEPQAAFYSWLAGEAGTHRERLDALAARHQDRPSTVLICDIGGGTTDFSLFSVANAQAGTPDIQRIAVSDHLLLGGDNIDLSLGYLLESRLVGAGRKLSSRQWAQLIFETRKLKERALSAWASEEAGEAAGGPVDADEPLYVSVAGEGASLFASSITASLTAREIEAHVLDGFLPDCGPDDGPRKGRTGLTQLGLPYAQDSAMTRHLAAFIGRRPVDAVLFNGGTLKPRFVRDRFLGLMGEWQGERPIDLENEAMDLAVALGAAHYGAVLRRSTGQIRGGYPRSLYVEVARAPRAASGDATGSIERGGQPEHVLVCIVPKGFDSRTPLRIEGLGLKALAGRPVRFQLFSSNRRDGDRPGDVVPLDAGLFHPLAPLHTRLDVGLDVGLGQGRDASRLIDVDLEVSLQETGVLNLECLARTPEAEGRRWQLDFNVRAVPVHDAEGEDASEDQTSVPLTANGTERLAQATERLETFFGKKKKDGAAGESPKYLVRDLEATLDLPRDQWDTPFLRALWPTLEQGLTRRNRSETDDIAWVYLARYALRPGYGFELDEWRVAELWRVFELGLAYPKVRQVEEQWWIMWRRVAGGLTRQQQEAVFDRIFPQIRKGEAVSPEIYMLAGSLERLEMGKKVRLGNHMTQQIVAGRKQFLDQRIWALARVASRVPLYGGPESIVRPKFVGDWFSQLKTLDVSKPPYNRLSLFFSQAGRVVRDREFDLPDELRRNMLAKLQAAKASDDQLRVVSEYVPVDTAARAQLFGESLPAGLLLS